MDPAHHGWRLRSAQIAASPRLGLLLIGRDSCLCLHGARFQVHATCAGKGSEREGTNSSAGDRFVLTLGQAGRQEDEAHDHQQAAHYDQKSA